VNFSNRLHPRAITANPEYEAGYNAFMRRVAYCYLAHAGDDAGCDNFVAAGRGDQSETAEYLAGWQDVKERMFREVQMDCGGCGTPRATTAMPKAIKSPNGLRVV
jgi:hypothetical protein